MPQMNSSKGEKAGATRGLKFDPRPSSCGTALELIKKEKRATDLRKNRTLKGKQKKKEKNREEAEKGRRKSQP